MLRREECVSENWPTGNPWSGEEHEGFDFAKSNAFESQLSTSELDIVPPGKTCGFNHFSVPWIREISPELLAAAALATELALALALLKTGPADAWTLLRPSEAFDVTFEAASFVFDAADEAESLAADAAEEALSLAASAVVDCCRKATRRSARREGRRRARGFAADMAMQWSDEVERSIPVAPSLRSLQAIG